MLAQNPLPEPSQARLYDGTCRICPPDQTVERFRPLFPLAGITRLANITGLDVLGIPVYTACRPNARSLSVSQGKGYTLSAAKASAIMESLETYHAETIQAPLYYSSYLEMQCQFSCADPFTLPRMADSLFSASERIAWMKGRNIADDTECWVPYECVHTDYASAPLPGAGTFVSSSNGLASGNSFEEALVHAICEVIERDAITLWSLRPAQERIRTAIDTDSVKSPRNREIIDRFRKNGVDIRLWDITSDTGIPAILCRAIPRLESDICGIRPTSGLGCHLFKEVALMRALTEAAQSRLSFIAGTRDDLHRKSYARYISAEEHARWREHGHAGSPQKNFADIRDAVTLSFASDLQVLTEALRRAGMQNVIAVDLTKEEIDVPVVKVVIPGMESFMHNRQIALGPRARRLKEGRIA